MGGNAIKKVTVSRIQANDYLRIRNMILTILKFNGIITDYIIETPNKESYGDIDILYLSDINNSLYNLLTINKICGDIKEIVNNGDVLSIPFEFENKYYQIDFIKCNNNNFNSSKFYYSYGDLGNIIGRITSQFGLKFGNNGLWLNYYLHDDVTKEHITIHLTYDPEEICNFLDLDYVTYINGFSNIDDIINWIIKCKYFNKNIFLFENLNYEHRKKAINRPMYIKFLEYISNLNDRDNNSSIIDLQKQCIDYFKKNEELENKLSEMKKRKELKEKFNGKDLIDLGIDSKLINKTILTFKELVLNKYQNYNDFNLYLENETRENILNDVKLLLNFK